MVRVCVRVADHSRRVCHTHAHRRILKESTDEIATLVVKHIRRKVMRTYNSSKDHGQHELIALTHKCMLQVTRRHTSVCMCVTPEPRRQRLSRTSPRPTRVADGDVAA